MSEFDAAENMRPGDPDRQPLGPIKPTGMGYRSASGALMAVAVGGILIGLLSLGTSRNVGFAVTMFWLAGWLLVVGVVLRIISDFLAALVDIARAVREGK